MKKSILLLCALLLFTAADYENHFNSAVALMNQKKYPEAEEKFKKALKADPNSREAKQSLGALYLEQCRLQEASDFAHDWLKKDPNNLSALILLGNANDFKGETLEEKTESCQTARALSEQIKKNNEILKITQQVQLRQQIEAVQKVKPVQPIVKPVEVVAPAQAKDRK